MEHINVNKQMKNSFEYDKNPASFSRGAIIRGNVPKDTLYVSGTASIGKKGETLHIDFFGKQLQQTYKNLSATLEGANFGWEHVVRTTIYLRDIDRDYEKFNIGRKRFFDEIGIKQYPASTCIEAKLCRTNLLCEIELIAVKPHSKDSKSDGTKHLG